MASTKFYLDTRRAKRDGTFPLKLAVSNKGRVTYISTGIDLSEGQWNDITQKVVMRADKGALNLRLGGTRQDVDELLHDLARNGTLPMMDGNALKRAIEGRLYPNKAEEEERAKTRLFAHNFRRTLAMRTEETRGVYTVTYNHMEMWLGKERFAKLAFEDITKSWLHDYGAHLRSLGLAQNTINMHFSHIRVVFNDALDEGVTTAYPFRKFKMRFTETAKRSLEVGDLRAIIGATGLKPLLALHRDIFALMFMLCGINAADMIALDAITREGRIEYHRRKTGRFYSIKVEPEAMEIIERHRGEKGLLSISDMYADHRMFSSAANDCLRKIIREVGLGLPNLTTYWARHTWATIASELDIPDDVISRALGHSMTSGARVTQRYIKFNRDKIDDANRRVIDWVLYGKR